MAERLDVTGEWQRVSMRYAVVESIGSVIGWLIVALGATVPIWLANDQRMPWWGWLPLAAAGALALIGVVWAFLRTRTVRVEAPVGRTEDRRDAEARARDQLAQQHEARVLAVDLARVDAALQQHGRLGQAPRLGRGERLLLRHDDER